MTSAINYSTDLLQREYEQRRPIREALESVVDQYEIRNLDVVELGSGLGFNLEIFRPHNRICGVEGLESAATTASNRGIPTMVANLDGRIPLPSDFADLVLCLDVLEHLVEPAACLAEVTRILKPRGHLVLNVPNQFTLSGRLNILFGSGVDSTRFFPEHPDWSNPHLRFFRRSSIGSLLEHCGLRVIDDWCWRFPAIPLVHASRRVSRSWLAIALAKRLPELFAGGFFLIAMKS